MKDAAFIAWMERESIAKIGRWPQRRISIELFDGRFGVGATVSEALAKAKAGADNIRKVAA